MLGFHLDFVAIAHDHFYVDNQMENESNKDQYNPIVNCLRTVGTLVLLVLVREMYSIAAINSICQ